MSYTCKPPLLASRKNMSVSPRRLKLPVPENCQFNPTAPSEAEPVMLLLLGAML
jgi:hypothetical protein